MRTKIILMPLLTAALAVGTVWLMSGVEVIDQVSDKRDFIGDFLGGSLIDEDTSPKDRLQALPLLNRRASEIGLERCRTSRTNLAVASDPHLGEGPWW